MKLNFLSPSFSFHDTCNQVAVGKRYMKTFMVAYRFCMDHPHPTFPFNDTCNQVTVGKRYMKTFMVAYRFCRDRFPLFISTPPPFFQTLNFSSSPSSYMSGHKTSPGSRCLMGSKLCSLWICTGQHDIDKIDLGSASSRVEVFLFNILPSLPLWYLPR